MALSSPLQKAAAFEPFIGQIIWVGFTFCPRGFAEANGQLLAISQNTALFRSMALSMAAMAVQPSPYPILEGEP